MEYTYLIKSQVELFDSIWKLRTRLFQANLQNWARKHSKQSTSSSSKHKVETTRLWVASAATPSTLGWNFENLLQGISMCATSLWRPPALSRSGAYSAPESIFWIPSLCCVRGKEDLFSVTSQLNSVTQMPHKTYRFAAKCFRKSASNPQHKIQAHFAKFPKEWVIDPKELHESEPCRYETNPQEHVLMLVPDMRRQNLFIVLHMQIGC